MRVFIRSYSNRIAIKLLEWDETLILQHTSRSFSWSDALKEIRVLMICCLGLTSSCRIIRTVCLIKNGDFSPIQHRPKSTVNKLRF